MPKRSFQSTPFSTLDSTDESMWFVLRDLRRANSKRFNWQDLRDSGFEVYTPLQSIVVRQGGKRIRKEVPVISDLLFVYASKSTLDPVIEKNPTLQYRFLKHRYMKPMTVRDEDLRRFMKISEEMEKVRYYTSEEMTASMIGKRGRVIGGPLNGYEGKILSVRGSKVKRLLVELPGIISAGVEVNPEFIEITDK